MLTDTNWLVIAACLALGLGFSWAAIILILRWSEKRNEGNRGSDFHHSHRAPIPRLGGIALVTGFLVSALSVYLFCPIPVESVHVLAVIILGSLAIFALGLCDDFRPLGAKFKLIAQIVIASAVYFSGVKIEIFKSPFTNADVPLGAFSYVTTVFWLVSLTNLINLIDGIDGLAAGICLMLMFLLANVGMGGDLGFSMLLATGAAGALIAFLRFNYPPAKIYMGDGGAYFLGFLIGILSIVNSNKGTVAAALIAPAFALALPIVDVSLAVLRRGLRGLPIFRPDQKHIHHHLLTLGISRERTLLNLYTVSLLCLFLAFGVFYLQGRMLPLYTGLLFLVLVIAGHLSSFTKDWYAISSQLGKSLALRRETQYALTLNRWLVLEAERCDSADEFWADFQFVLKKLRFAKVRIILPGGSQKVWWDDDCNPNSEDFHHAIHEIGNGTILEFHASKAVLSGVLFNLLGDLAAETWHKIASQWKMSNKAPLFFSSPVVHHPDFPKEYKSSYEPLEST